MMITKCMQWMSEKSQSPNANLATSLMLQDQVPLPA